ncbi:MAG TPA: hypothetical protein EYQ31_18420 [Candidatus Handelsmanbacteria bacterium]|nr:hypothetical protein [Candidatus Handelsmanbacteria bacterium]
MGMEAALRFDEKRGFRFITYAVWWIRQAILRSSARRRRMVTAPSNRVEDLKKVERIQTRLTQELGRSPTDDEIAHVGTPEIRLDLSLFGEEEDDDVLSQFSTPEAPVDERLETREARDSSIAAWTFWIPGSARSSAAIVVLTASNR